MSDKANGFFSRWQQRRQQVAEEAEKEQLPQEVAESQLPEQEQTQPAAEQTPQTVAEGEEPKLLTAEDLPDPEKIEEGGSFAAFMANNVDPLAKKAALRALWKQPHFNEIDGLAEYALDYSNQPKLTSHESAELVKKVFRRVIEKEEKEKAEQEARLAAEREAAAQQSDQESIAEVESQQVGQIAETSNEESASLTQNVPEESLTTPDKVGKGQFS